MAYEYSSIVDAIELKAGLADTSLSEFREAMAFALQNSVAKLPSAIQSKLLGEDWEVVSHDLTRIDRYLLLTVLLRRLA